MSNARELLERVAAVFGDDLVVEHDDGPLWKVKRGDRVATIGLSGIPNLDAAVADAEVRADDDEQRATKDDGRMKLGALAAAEAHVAGTIYAELLAPEHPSDAGLAAEKFTDTA